MVSLMLEYYVDIKTVFLKNVRCGKTFTLEC